MKSKTNALRRNRIQMNTLESEKTGAMTTRGKLELECKELEEGLKTGEEIRLANERELARLSAEIEKATSQLEEEIEPSFNKESARLMKRLEDQKLGRVTFLPLNRLRVDHVNYPDSADVKPLLSHCIRYDPRVDRAMRHIFARKLLARSVEVASTWSAKSGLDAITLDGDLCSSKGALSGGYVDPLRSRLRAFGQHQEARRALDRAEKEHTDVKRKAQTVDQSVTNLMAELQRLEAKHADLLHVLSETENEIAQVQSRVGHQKKSAEQAEKHLVPSLENEVKSMQAEIGRLEEEMMSEMTSTLSDEEREALTKLKARQGKASWLSTWKNRRSVSASSRLSDKSCRAFFPTTFSKDSGSCLASPVACCTASLLKPSCRMHKPKNRGRMLSNSNVLSLRTPSRSPTLSRPGWLTAVRMTTCSGPIWLQQRTSLNN